MANKRGGLSKREYAAKQAGGKLDYKTGSISVSKPKTSTPTKTQSGSSSLSGIKSLNEKYSGKPANSWSPGDVALLRSYQSNQDLGNQAVAYQNTQKVNIAQTAKDNAVAEKKKNRKTASPVKDIYQHPTNEGANVANPYHIGEKISLQPGRSQGSAFGKLFTGVANRSKAANPILSWAEGAAKSLASGFDVSDMLGINTAHATGLADYANEKGEVLGVDDSRTISDYERNNGSIPEDVSQILRDADVRRQGDDILKTSGFTAASDYIQENRNSDSNRDTSNRDTGRTPRRIVYDQTPQFTPRTSQPESITPQFTSIVPDYTPVSTGQPGTQRRFLGNGMLSNGIASNGKLDQNLDGLSYGSAPSDEDSLLRELLGINTAQAADLPQQMAFGNKTTPMSSFQSGFESGGLTLDPGYSMPQVLQRGMQQETQGTNENYAPRQMAQNPGGSQGGGVSQQYSQGATGGNTMDGYYNKQLKSQNKAFSAQEKAQKRALEELLKSIKNQYGTQQTEGINTLNKSKQEDLLKLSGLFNFANQDPNSEQRVQYEQRANQDYADQQTDFLAKLAAAQGQEESQARQGYQSQMSNLAGQRNDARSRIEELIFKAQQDELDRNSRARSSGGVRALSGTAAGSITHIGDNAKGEPVYRNNQTGEMQVGYGLTRKSQDPYAQMMESIMGQGGQQQEQTSTDTDGNPIVFRNGQWEYLN